MIDPAFCLRVAKVDYRVEHPLGSVERIDRVAVLKQLIHRQNWQQSDAATARPKLLAEIRPAPIGPAALREPTRPEIENFDWDENEHERVIGRRPTLKPAITRAPSPPHCLRRLR
jgi:hypothetical protein